MSTYEKLQKCLREEFQIFAILPAISAMSTILVCYVVAVDVYGHIPAWFSLPEISLLGARQPEHTIYQIGAIVSTLTSLLFYVSFGHFLRAVVGERRREFRLSTLTMRGSILLFSVGLLLQGLFTLSPQRLQHLDDSNLLQWTPDTQVHELV